MTTYVIVGILALAVGAIILWNLKQGPWNEFKEDEVIPEPKPVTRPAPKKKASTKPQATKKVVAKKAKKK